MAVPWDKSRYASFTLWDIDREFQNAHEAYEQWQARNRRKRSTWECLSGRNQDDALGRALSLGRNVQKLMDSGKEEFGWKFERGDSICHTILSAQLLRVLHEISVPLLDCAFSRVPIAIPFDEILSAAKAVRRTCLFALRDQYARLQSPDPAPFLPPPRFSVKFCLFALQLQQDRKKKHIPNFQAAKVRPHDRHDEREICPHCCVQISVSPHSGLPDYRRILFQSHIALSTSNLRDSATFACSSCYKTFEDSYAYLDHVFQRQIGSEKSCLKRWSSQWTINEVYVESNPQLVEKCLQNCLKRELIRVGAITKAKELGT